MAIYRIYRSEWEALLLGKPKKKQSNGRASKNKAEQPKWTKNPRAVQNDASAGQNIATAAEAEPARSREVEEVTAQFAGTQLGESSGGWCY